MGFETVQLERHQAVAMLTMNRPDRLNAITGPMFRELRTALEQVARDDSARVLVLTGAGRAFCSGVDQDEERQVRMGIDHPPTIEEVRRYIRDNGQAILRIIRSMEKPTIAMVNGVAVANAVDWAFACDIRTGSKHTRFINGFVRFASFPNTGATWLYPRIMGLGRALEFMYTGDALEAEESYRIGVLNHLYPATDLVQETLNLAQRIAEGPPISQRLMKEYTYRSLETGLEAALELAASGESMTLFTDDNREAQAAHKEKRKPRFSGR